MKKISILLVSCCSFIMLFSQNVQLDVEGSIDVGQPLSKFSVTEDNSSFGTEAVRITFPEAAPPHSLGLSVTRPVSGFQGGITASGSGRLKNIALISPDDFSSIGFNTGVFLLDGTPALDAGLRFDRPNKTMDIFAVDTMSISIGQDGREFMKFSIDESTGINRIDFDFGDASSNVFWTHSGIDWRIITTNHEFGVIGNFTSALWLVSANQFAAADAANYNSYSDARIKENVHNMENMVSRIMDLRPVEYDLTKEHFYKSKREKPEKDRLNRMGFIAQEMKDIFPTLVHHDKESDLYSVGYMGLIPALTQAIQEQQKAFEKNETEKEQLQQEVTALKAQVVALTTLAERVATLENNLQTCCLKHQNSQTSESNSNYNAPDSFQQDKAQLQQNFPNPFHQQTEIQYYLPNNTTTAALHISDGNGKILRTYKLTQKGVGKVTLNGGQLAVGKYAYTLTIDGQIVDTKQMILTK